MAIISTAHRRATLKLRVTHTPTELSDWGALGALVGRHAGDYWQVPAVLGIDSRAGLGRAQALRRRNGQLWLGCFVPYRRHHARS
jgi:predicted aconitase